MIFFDSIVLPFLIVEGLASSCISLGILAISVKRPCTWAYCKLFPWKAIPFDKPLLSNAVISTIVIVVMGALGAVCLWESWKMTH